VFEEILKHPKIIELEEALKQGNHLLVEELWNAPKALIAALAVKVTGCHVLILTGGSQEESRLYTTSLSSPPPLA
jgi:transcription-repair coupling factor (superfamily II helicase)